MKPSYGGSLFKYEDPTPTHTYPGKSHAILRIYMSVLVNNIDHPRIASTTRWLYIVDLDLMGYATCISGERSGTCTVSRETQGNLMALLGDKYVSHEHISDLIGLSYRNRTLLNLQT